MIRNFGWSVGIINTLYREVELMDVGWMMIWTDAIAKATQSKNQCDVKHHFDMADRAISRLKELGCDTSEIEQATEDYKTQLLSQVAA